MQCAQGLFFLIQSCLFFSRKSSVCKNSTSLRVLEDSNGLLELFSIFQKGQQKPALFFFLLEMSPYGLNKMSSFLASGSNHINLVQQQRSFLNRQGLWQEGLWVMNKAVRKKNDLLLKCCLFGGSFLKDQIMGKHLLINTHGINMGSFCFNQLTNRCLIHLQDLWHI